jgi:hypothetical protein
LVATAVGCAPSLKSYSVGRVGCPADEIEISDENEDVGAKTWTVSCRGQTYYCGMTVTANPGVYGGQIGVSSATDVSCTPAAQEAPQSTSAAKASVQPFAQSVAPRGAGGFEFAATRDAAQKLCTDGGKRWATRTDGSFECSGPLADLGFDATVRLRGCASGICEVALIVPPVGSEAALWVRQYADLRAALERRYGTDRILAPNADPGACVGDALKQCLLTGDLKAQATWRWRDGTTMVLQMTKASDEAMQVQIVYRDRAWMGAPRAGAL